MEKRVAELQSNIHYQRIHLTKEIFEIKEVEFHQRYSCNSSCVVGCRIFHQKHDWFRSVSVSLLDKLDKISIECELCEDSVEKMSGLEEHLKMIHVINPCENSLGSVENTNTEHIELNRLEANIDAFQSISEEAQKNEPFLEESSVLESETISDVETNEKVVRNLCNVCLLSFKTEKDLNHHIQMHTKARKMPSILKNK